MTLPRLSRLLTYQLFRQFRRGRRPPPPPPPGVTVHAANPVPVPDGGGNSDWAETWAPSDGGIDVWTAIRYLDGDLQVEYELSCREAVEVGAVTLTFNGFTSLVIPVNREWPAGRALSGRLGAEFDLHPDWDPSAAGPLDMPLPTIPDQAAQDAVNGQRLQDLRECIADGRAGNANATVTLEDFMDGIVEPWEGPFPCWGLQNGGAAAPGGNGIYHPWGWQGGVTYARLCLEIEAVAMTRMWCWRKGLSGRHASVDDYLPGLSPRVDDEAGIRLVGWDTGADLVMRPQSVTHLVRVLRYVGAAAEMTQSPLALRHLEQLAEYVRMVWSESGVIAAIEFGSGYTAHNLSTFEALAYNRTIHTGLYTDYGYGWDRGHGWAMYTAAMAMKMGVIDSAGWDNWAERILGALEYCQMPNGIIGRVKMPHTATLPPYNYPDTVDIAASMHEALLGIGAKALSYQTGVAIPGIDAAHAAAMYNNSLNVRQLYNGDYGPWHWMSVGVNGGVPYSTITTGYSEPSDPLNPGDPAHVESYLAVKIQHDSPTPWTARSLRYGSPAATVEAKVVDMTNETSTLGRNWRAWLFALLQ